MIKHVTRRLGAAVAALAIVSALAGPHLSAHAAPAHFLLHRQVHFAGRMFYQDGSVVPQATVYVMPYGAQDTNQAYESFAATNGYYRTPMQFTVARSYTIYIVCADAYGNQYSYTDDFRPHASYSYNEYAGTAYMQPDQYNSDNGSGGGDN